MFAGREKEKGHGYSKAAAEVCKYALKFGDLSVEKTWEAFKVLKGKRLTGSFGLLWGVKIPETMTDDMPDDETLPYMEMLYKFVYGKKSHYDLAITRMVEPKARERAEEKEATTTTYERDIAGGSITRRCEDVAGARARSHGTSATRTKKPHWRIPPSTRVRVRQRIRRWDGYLYNIDLFPYVEHRLLAFIEG